MDELRVAGGLRDGAMACAAWRFDVETCSGAEQSAEVMQAGIFKGL